MKYLKQLYQSDVMWALLIAAWVGLILWILLIITE